MTDENLLPCPFCGCTFTPYPLGNELAISHPNDDCILSEFTISYNKYVKKWNTHHDSGKLPEWLKTAIKKKIENIKENLNGSSGPLRLASEYKKSGLDWVLSLKPPEYEEGTK